MVRLLLPILEKDFDVINTDDIDVVPIVISLTN